MKKQSLILLCFLLTSLGSKAEVYIDNFIYELYDDHTASLIGTRNKSRITSVVIPETISFGGRAYKVTTIEGYAFDGCENLTKVTMPDKVFSFPGFYAFGENNNIEEVHISNLTTWLKSDFDRGNNPLRSGARLFLNGEELIHLVIPEGIEVLQGFVFEGCESLQSVSTSSATTIRGWTFASCVNLNKITITESVTDIASDAFIRCNNITTLDLNCKNVGNWFADSKNSITSVVLGDSVKTIGESAFKFFYKLASITLSKSVKSIGNSAFEGCTSLKEVNISDLDAFLHINFGLYAPLFYAHHLYLNGQEVTGEVVFPSDITEICNAIFEGCEGITSVVIPEGVKRIGRASFQSCSNLESVSLPSTLEEVGIEAFGYCSSLKSILIPDNVTVINENAFRYCTDLTSINIPKSVTRIGSNALMGCYFSTFTNHSSLNSNDNWGATICDEETMDGLLIKDKVVVKCRDWATSVVIPDNVTSIEGYAFDGCNNLTKVTMPDKVISFPGYYAFGENNNIEEVHISNLTTWLKSDFDRGNNPLRSGARLFLNGEELIHLVIPEGIEVLQGLAFEGCESLQSVSTSSATTIRGWTFASCINLNKITITESMTNIASDAFRQCTNITALDLQCENVGNWFADSKESITSVVLGDSVKTIGESAFSGFTGLTSINIPEGVTSIGQSAFNGCTGLTSINIPNSVTSIGQSAFNGCTGLTSVTIGEGVTSVGSDAFQGCTNITALDLQCQNVRKWFGDSKESITTVTLGEKVKSIGESAFSGFTGLTSITIPNSVTSIGQSAFNGCTGLTSINIPEGVTSIGQSAFNGCTGLTSINIPEGVTSVGSNAFQGCTNITALDLQCQNVGKWFGDSKESITSVSLGKGVKSITSDAFSGFSNLSKVSIDDIAAWCAIDFGNADANPLKQAKHLFRKNREITELGIPSDVEAIKQYAFYGCEGLTSVSIPSSVKSIGSYAFADCINLTSVVSEIGIPFKLDETAFTYTDTSYPDNIIYMLATLYVPAGRDALYKQIDGWKNFTNIMVVQAVESVSLSETSVILEEIGATCQLQATVLPDDANNKTVTWASSDEAVCTVSETGLVTATGAGVASVTVTTADGGKTATCEVTVVIPVKSIALDVETLQLTVGETGQIVATVQPDNATDKSVEWTSSDDAVATVDENGMIAAIKEGTAYITVKSVSYPEVMAVCEVTVVEADGIFAIEMGGAQQVRAIYDVSGRKVETLQKGLNIARLRDGTIKRVFIK